MIVDVGLQIFILPPKHCILCCANANVHMIGAPVLAMAYDRSAGARHGVSPHLQTRQARQAGRRAAR